MNLDRFSQPMSWENRKFDPFWDNDQQEKELPKCCGCGIEIYEEEDFVESEIWEDEFIHNDQECIQAYYAKEKRAAGQGNS